MRIFAKLCFSEEGPRCLTGIEGAEAQQGVLDREGGFSLRSGGMQGHVAQDQCGKALGGAVARPEQGHSPPRVADGNCAGDVQGIEDLERHRGTIGQRKIWCRRSPAFSVERHVDGDAGPVRKLCDAGIPHPMIEIHPVQKNHREWVGGCLAEMDRDGACRGAEEEGSFQLLMETAFLE